MHGTLNVKMTERETFNLRNVRAVGNVMFNTKIFKFIFCLSATQHPLWPQNKGLRTPWTTDYMHTRQDRWIQTKLAFTLAKNATKPNPLEIIPPQTTRKENSWKTEQTLETATVTLKMEWIKGSSPWCLWWWRSTQQTAVTVTQSFHQFIFPHGNTSRFLRGTN